MRVHFFCQAEDGIRVVAVTGVQTCALPIAIQDAGRLVNTGISSAIATLPSLPESQIGRASCRERV